MLQTYTHCHQKFEEHCLKNPSSMALATSNGTMSYAELNRLSNYLASYLLSSVATCAEDVIAQCAALDNVSRPELLAYEQPLPKPVLIICDQTKPEFLIALLATLKAGLPFLLFDPDSISKNDIGRLIIRQGLSAAESELAHVQEDFEPWLIIGDGQVKPPQAEANFLECHINLDNSTISLKANGLLPTETKGLSTENPTTDFPPNRLGYYIYTSGTTKKPKAMAHTQAGLSLRIESLLSDLINPALTEKSHPAVGKDNVFLQFCPLRFDGSLCEILYALTTGAALRLLDQQHQRDLSFYFSDENKVQPNSFVLMPIAYINCVEWAQQDDRYRKMFENTRLLLTTGSQANCEALEKILVINPDMAIVDGYGPTEAHVGSNGSIYRRDGKISLNEITFKGLNTHLRGIDANSIENEAVRTRVAAYPSSEDFGEIMITEQRVSCQWKHKPYALITMTLGYVTSRRFNRELMQDRFMLDDDLFTYATGDIAIDHPDHREILGRKDKEVQQFGKRTNLCAFEEVISECLVPQFDGLKIHVIMQENEQFLVECHHNGDIDINKLKDAIQSMQAEFGFNFNYLLVQNGSQQPIRMNEHEAIELEYEQHVAMTFSQILDTYIDDRNTDFTLAGGDSIKLAKLLFSLKTLFELRSIPYPLSSIVLKDITRHFYLTKCFRDCFSTLDEAKANRPNLFCLYPISGDANVFRAVNEQKKFIFEPIMSDVNIYLLDSPEYQLPNDAYLKACDPLTDDERGFYIAQALRQHQPEGDYHLYAWSYGGRLVPYIVSHLQKMIQAQQNIKVFMCDPIRANYDAIHDQVSHSTLPHVSGNVLITNLLFRVFDKIITFPKSQPSRFRQSLVEDASQFQQSFVETYRIPEDSEDQLVAAKLVIEKFFDALLRALPQMGLTISQLSRQRSSFLATKSNILDLLNPPREFTSLNCQQWVFCSDDLTLEEKDRIQRCYPDAELAHLENTDHFTMLNDSMISKVLSEQIHGSKIRQAAKKWHLKNPIPSQFYQRRQAVNTLIQDCREGKIEHNQLILFGPSGSGKTSILIDVLNSLKDEIPCFWFDAHNLDHAFLDFAKAIGLEADTPQSAIAAVKEFFQTESNWAIFFDDIPNREVGEQYFPNANGLILGTTIFEEVTGIFGQKVEPMASDEQDKLLSIARSYGLKDENDESILRLSAQFNNLLQPIIQAAIYIRRNEGCTIDSFLKTYHDLSDCSWLQLDYHKELLQFGNKTLQKSVFVTAKLILDNIEECAPALLKFLECCSYIDSNDIAIDLFQPLIDAIDMNELLHYLGEVIMVSDNEGESTLRFQPSFHLAMQVWFRDRSQFESANIVLKSLLDKARDFHYQHPSSWRGMVRLARHIGLFIQKYMKYRGIYNIHTYHEEFLSLVFRFLNYQGKALANYNSAYAIGDLAFDGLSTDGEKRPLFSKVGLEEYLQFACSMCYLHLGRESTPEKFIGMGNSILETYDQAVAEGVEFSDELGNDIYNIRSHIQLLDGRTEQTGQNFELQAVTAYLQNDLKKFLHFSFLGFIEYQDQTDRYKLEALYGLALFVTDRIDLAKYHFRCGIQLIEHMPNVNDKIHAEISFLYNTYNFMRAAFPTHQPRLTSSFFHCLALLMTCKMMSLPQPQGTQYAILSVNLLEQAYQADSTNILNSYEYANILWRLGQHNRVYEILRAQHLCDDQDTVFIRDVYELDMTEQPLRGLFQQHAQFKVRLELLAHFLLTRIYPHLDMDKKAWCQHQMALYKERQVICEHQADEILIADIAQSPLFNEARYHHRFEQAAANVAPQIANLVQTHRAFGQQPAAPQVGRPANPPPQQVEAANLLFGLLAAFQQAAQQQGSGQQQDKPGGPGNNK